MKQGRFILYHNNHCLWNDVLVMESFPQRLLGMLHQSGIPRQRAYWFPRCSAIHSWGMRFAIDVVGLNKKQEIVAVYRNIQPGRVLHIPAAASVIECEAGYPLPLESWQGCNLQFIQKEVTYG